MVKCVNKFYHASEIYTNTDMVKWYIVGAYNYSVSIVYMSYIFVLYSIVVIVVITEVTNAIPVSVTLATVGYFRAIILQHRYIYIDLNG